MQLLFFITILISLYTLQAESNPNVVKKLLESSKDIEIPHLELNFTSLNNPAYSGMIIMDNIIISGLSGIKLTDLEVKPIIIGGLGVSIKAAITLPSSNLSTDYNANCILNKYEIFGSGELLHELKEFSFDIEIALIFKPFTLSKFRILPSVEDIKLSISGFLNDTAQSALLGQMVDDVAVQWINEKSPDFADVIEDFVKSIINTNLYTSRGYYEH